MGTTINIAIADDHNLFIEGLKQLFQDEDDIVVKDIANNGRELLSILPNHTIDIILMDINMPELNGLDTIKYLKQSHPAIKTIFLSTYNDDHLVEKARLLGVNGYLLKTADKAELLQTIRLVNAGQSCFPYRQQKHKNEFDLNDNFLKQFNLTKRELEILHLIKNNYTNQQIADQLFLSIYTVETHRKNIMQKTGLKTPSALMKFIVENKL